VFSGLCAQASSASRPEVPTLPSCAVLLSNNARACSANSSAVLAGDTLVPTSAVRCQQCLSSGSALDLDPDPDPAIKLKNVQINLSLNF
jgi:hypothetical protein